MSGRFVMLVVLLGCAVSVAATLPGQQAPQPHAKSHTKFQAKLQSDPPAEGQTATPAAVLPGAQAALTTPPTVVQSNGPSLAETTQWIEGHMTGLAHGRSRTTVTYRLKKGKPPKEESRENVSSNESVSVAKFDGCVLTLGQLTKGDDFTVVTLSTVPFDRLTSASWRVEKLDSSRSEAKDEAIETTIMPASVAVLTLQGPTNVISYRRRSTGSIPLEWIQTPFEGERSTLVIQADDQEMPPRLVNAFNHAIQLCHKDSKPEPF